MKDYKILTQGDKIKYIRNKFDFKQEELAGEDITRNLISIIENNKANLTESVAKILTANINRLCKERKINFSVAEEYLLEDVVSQAKRIADEYIKEVIEVSDIARMDELAYEIDLFLKNYTTEEKKAKLYFEIGVQYKEILRQYVKAIPYFIKSYESSREMCLISRSLLMLTSCHIYLSRYDEALNYIKTVMDLDSTPLTQFRSKYNMALCYKKLTKYDEAIEVLKDIFEHHEDIIDSDPDNAIALKMLRGSCLTELKSFNKAIATYKELLKLVNNEKDIVCILSNLADVYRTLNDTKNLDITCKKILNKINSNIDLSEYEAYVYIELSKNLRSLDSSCEIGISLLYKALDKYKNRTCSLYTEDVENLIIELLNLFIITGQPKKIEFLKNDMFELIEKNLFPKNSKSAFKFINYYNVNGLVSEITDMINYLS